VFDDPALNRILAERLDRAGLGLISDYIKREARRVTDEFTGLCERDRAALRDQWETARDEFRAKSAALDAKHAQVDAILAELAALRAATIKATTK
jgi:hypothetical protein